MYDPDRELCCAGKLENLHKGNRCCGTKAYRDDKYICCEGKKKKRKGYNSRCCGKYSYDPSDEICCGTNIIKVRRNVLCQNYTSVE